MQVAQCQTITKLRVLSSGQQLLRLDFENKFAKAQAQALSERCLKVLADYDLLILSDYNKGSLGDIQALIQAASALSMPVLHPKAYAVDHYRNATLLTQHERV